MAEVLSVATMLPEYCVTASEGAGSGCEMVLLRAGGWLVGETTSRNEFDVHAAGESPCL